MKKLIISVVVIISVITAFTSCQKKIEGQGPVVTEIRTVPGFEGIQLAVPADLIYTQAPEYKVELRAQQNILNIIETPVVIGELRIHLKTNTNIKAHERIIIHIHSPNIRNLEVSGSGNLKTVGKINSPQMRLAISGSGVLQADSLYTGAIESVISGSGNILVKTGTGTQANAFVSGSGSLDLQEVTVNTANAKISGSGTIKLQVSQTLDVKISGSGSVYYTGSPVITSSISGSGKVIKL